MISASISRESQRSTASSRSCGWAPVTAMWTSTRWERSRSRPRPSRPPNRCHKWVRARNSNHRVAGVSDRRIWAWRKNTSHSRSPRWICSWVAAAGTGVRVVRVRERCDRLKTLLREGTQRMAALREANFGCLISKNPLQLWTHSQTLLWAELQRWIGARNQTGLIKQSDWTRRIARHRFSI